MAKPTTPAPAQPQQGQARSSQSSPASSRGVSTVTTRPPPPSSSFLARSKTSIPATFAAATNSNSRDTGRGSRKRKHPGGVRFYAVKAGVRPGVYQSWDECRAQVNGFKGSVYKSFSSREEADAFVSGSTAVPGPLATHIGAGAGAASAAGSSSRPSSQFYAVRNGRIPGVYDDWEAAQQQIQGFGGATVRRFATLAEAQAFVRGSKEQQNAMSTASDGSTEPAEADGMWPKRRLIDKDELSASPAAATQQRPLSCRDTMTPVDFKTGQNVSTVPIERQPSARTPSQQEQQQQQQHHQQHRADTGTGLLTIHTDGSSLANGRLGARAGVGVYFGPADPRNVSEPLRGPRQTNQRAELTAILRALERAPRSHPVRVVTDSNYSINCVTVWCEKWRRNAWQTVGRKPVENRDLIMAILNKVGERKGVGAATHFHWVKGHNRDVGNEAADQLAVSGAHRELEAEDAHAEGSVVVHDTGPGGEEDEFDDGLDDSDIGRLA